MPTLTLIWTPNAYNHIQCLHNKEVPRHQFWQAWRALLSSEQTMFGSLLQVIDDCTHCVFMVLLAMLKVEICEGISREYISRKKWRSHSTCYEFYGGSDSCSLQYISMYACVRGWVLLREREEIKVSINLINGKAFSAKSVVLYDSFSLSSF